MDLIFVIANFLDNGSVSAFFGAAAAFFLVFLTDLRRRSKRRKTLRESIQGALMLAKRIQSAIEQNRDLLRDRDTLHPGRVQSFPTTMIETLLFDQYDELPQAERSGMDVLVFRMRAIDDLLNGIERDSERLYRLYIDKNVGAESNALKRYILIDYEAVITNLQHLCELGEMYLNRDYDGMRRWRYPTRRSESIPT